MPKSNSKFGTWPQKVGQSEDCAHVRHWSQRDAACSRVGKPGKQFAVADVRERPSRSYARRNRSTASRLRPFGRGSAMGAFGQFLTVKHAAQFPRSGRSDRGDLTYATYSSRRLAFVSKRTTKTRCESHALRIALPRHGWQQRLVFGGVTSHFNDGGVSPWHVPGIAS